MSSGDVTGPATVVTSTEGMIRRAAASPASTFIVATEVGILHRMEAQSPGKRFLAASEAAVCPYMKKITLEKVALALERMGPRGDRRPGDRRRGARRHRQDARDFPDRRLQDLDSGLSAGASMGLTPMSAIPRVSESPDARRRPGGLS